MYAGRIGWSQNTEAARGARLLCKSGKLPQMDAALTRLAAIDIGNSIRTGVAPLSRASPIGTSGIWQAGRRKTAHSRKAEMGPNQAWIDQEPRSSLVWDPNASPIFCPEWPDGQVGE